MLFKCSPFEFLDRDQTEIRNLYRRVLDVIRTANAERENDG